MITSTQAQQYLDQVLGVSVPAFLLASAIGKVAVAEQRMIDAGYDEHTRTMVQCIAVALVAAAGDPRRLGSQGAPSGASRSFRYKDGDLSALRQSLQTIDSAGTVAEVVGRDPAGGTMFMVVG